MGPDFGSNQPAHVPAPGEDPHSAEEHTDGPARHPGEPAGAKHACGHLLGAAPVRERDVRRPAEADDSLLCILGAQPWPGVLPVAPPSGLAPDLPPIVASRWLARRPAREQSPALRDVGPLK